MKVKSESEVAQLCLTSSDPMDYSLPASSIHGIFQARVLEWVAVAFSVIGYTQIQNKELKKKLWTVNHVITKLLSYLKYEQFLNIIK